MKHTPKHMTCHRKGQVSFPKEKFDGMRPLRKSKHGEFSACAGDNEKPVPDAGLYVWLTFICNCIFFVVKEGKIKRIAQNVNSCARGLHARKRSELLVVVSSEMWTKRKLSSGQSGIYTVYLNFAGLGRAM